MALATTSKTIDFVDVRPEVGSYVQLDNGRLGELLLEGDDYVDDSFPGCQFRYPNPIREWAVSRALACNVSVTGRTFQYRQGGRWVRVLVEWVGDGEPNTYTGGWMAC